MCISEPVRHATQYDGGTRGGWNDGRPVNRVEHSLRTQEVHQLS